MKVLRDGLYLIRRLGDGVLGLDPVPRVSEGYRGINVVQDGPAEGVPEPGGLPGAEPTLTDHLRVARAYAEPESVNPRRCTDGFLGHVWDGLIASSATRCLICRVEWSPERAYSWQIPSGDRRDYGVDAAGEERKPVQAERPAGVYR